MLQNDLKISVALFTTHIQTSFATNQVVAVLEEWVEKVQSGYTFLLFFLYVLRVLPAQGKLVLQQEPYVYGVTLT